MSDTNREPYKSHRDAIALMEQYAAEISRQQARGDSAHALVADQMRTISGQLDEIERLRGLLREAADREREESGMTDFVCRAESALAGAAQQGAAHGE